MAEGVAWISEHAVWWSLGVVCLASASGYALARWAHDSALGASTSRRLSARARALLACSMVFGVVLFLGIVWALRSPGGSLDAFDQALARDLAQSLPKGTLQLVAIFTQLGDRAFLMGVGASVLAMLLWHRRLQLALLWVAACAGGGLLNKFLKALFERVRPEHAHGFLQAEGFSFPSGHATGAVAIYGMLAFVLTRTVAAHRHPVLLAGAFGLIAAIGLSRVLLHVHYVSDVMAGWAVTFAWIAACILVADVASRRQSH